MAKARKPYQLVDTNRSLNLVLYFDPAESIYLIFGKRKDQEILALRSKDKERAEAAMAVFSSFSTNNRTVVEMALDAAVRFVFYAEFHMGTEDGDLKIRDNSLAAEDLQAAYDAAKLSLGW